MRFPHWITAAVLVGAASTLFAGDAPKLKDALQDDRLAGAWIYDDIDAGFKEAKATGKPLLISFCCVP